MLDLALIVFYSIDGWGIGKRPPAKGDAIGHAKTPIMTKMRETEPFVELEASGLAVGLSEGLMGDDIVLNPASQV